MKFLKVSHEETKTDVLEEIKFFKDSILTGVMQRQKHIIFYSSVPAALGTQKGTASPFKHLKVAALCVFTIVKNFWTYFDQKKKVADRFLTFQGNFSASLPTKTPNPIFRPFFPCRLDRLFLKVSCFNSIKFMFQCMLFRSGTCAERAKGKHLAPGSFWHFRFWLKLKRSQSSLRDTHLRTAAYSTHLFIYFRLSILMELD